MAKVLTPARRARLEKLAAYLERLPANYQHFDMSIYLSSDAPDEVVRYARENGGVASCGTVACAVGHGPAAGVLVPPRFLGNYTVNWTLYSDMFTGPGFDLYAWCFSQDWAAYDNHHHGAAARIRLLLDKGRPPEAFDPYWMRPSDVALYAPYRIDAKAQADA